MEENNGTHPGTARGCGKGRVAGHHLLKAADTTLPPSDAVSRLKARLPAAFRPDVRTMSPAEYRVHQAAFLTEASQRESDARQAATTAATTERERVKYAGR